MVYRHKWICSFPVDKCYNYTRPLYSIQTFSLAISPVGYLIHIGSLKRILAKKSWFQCQRAIFSIHIRRLPYTSYLVGNQIFLLFPRCCKLRGSLCNGCHHFRHSHVLRTKEMDESFAIITICAIYGMGISGTRAAMAVPFGGIALFILVSKSWKSFALSTLAFIAVFSFFNFTTIGDGNQYIRKMRSAFRPSEDASYQVRVENRKKMKDLMDEKPIGYGIGLSKGAQYGPKEVMPYPPDSWLVAVWVETGIVGLVLYLLIHGVLFAWCSWLLMFRIMNQRLRGLLAAWLCMNAGFFVAAYANDVMQYPNSIIVYTGFALCIAGPYIDPVMQKEDEELERERKEKKKRD